MIDRELIAGPRGTALQMDLPPMEGKTTLAQWFMTLPGQHPFWSKYVLSVIHLRDEESTAPAKKDYPEATYEICLIALDPERKPVPENRETWRFLTPLNARVQFHGITDEQAAEVCALAARALTDGFLPAEPDHPLAKAFWTKAIKDTVEHYSNPEFQQEAQKELAELASKRAEEQHIPADWANTPVDTVRSKGRPMVTMIAPSGAAYTLYEYLGRVVQICDTTDEIYMAYKDMGGGQMEYEFTHPIMQDSGTMLGLTLGPDDVQIVQMGAASPTNPAKKEELN